MAGHPWFDSPSFASLFDSSVLDVIREGFAEQAWSINDILQQTATRNLSDILRFQSAIGTLSKAKDFESTSVSPTFYSTEMETPGSYFERHEVVVRTFRDLNAAIASLTEKHVDLPLVWRGAQDASWGMHSSLYRHLMRANGVISPSEHPTIPQNYPDENQMVSAEKAILRAAREDWRFDDMSALELFARIQHVGGPTRLLDVSQNPYVAAWFAVESNPEHDDKDGRLFALATRPTQSDPDKPIPSRVLLDEQGGARTPFWHRLDSDLTRQSFDWGTGARRWFWVPPAYDPRILAQNAGFLLDGVPMTSPGTQAYFRKAAGSGHGYWLRSDLLAAASIYAKTYEPTRKVRSNRQNFAPVFSFRITEEAKRDIRAVLESRFGYRMSSIYPDISGLASALKSMTF
jgi:hypothetical protein